MCFPPWIKYDHRLLTYSFIPWVGISFNTSIHFSQPPLVDQEWEDCKMHPHAKQKPPVKFWLLLYLVHTIQILFPTVQLLVLCQCSDKGQMFELSVLKTLYGDRFTLPTQLIKPNFFQYNPPMQPNCDSFFRNLPPFDLWPCFNYIILQRAVTMVPAHDSPVAAMAFNSAGTKLSTASEKVGLFNG